MIAKRSEKGCQAVKRQICEGKKKNRPIRAIGFARTLSGRPARQPFTPVLVQIEEMEERPGDLELGKATRRTRMFLSRRSCALIACDDCACWQNYTNFHLHRMLRDCNTLQKTWFSIDFPTFANFLRRNYPMGI